MNEREFVEELKKGELKVKGNPEALRKSTEVLAKNLELVSLITLYSYKMAQLLKELKKKDEFTAAATTAGVFTQILKELSFEDENVVRIVKHMLIGYFRSEDLEKFINRDKEAREATEKLLGKYEELLKSISGQAEVSGNGG